MDCAINSFRSFLFGQRTRVITKVDIFLQTIVTRCGFPVLAARSFPYMADRKPSASTASVLTYVTLTWNSFIVSRECVITAAACYDRNC